MSLRRAKPFTFRPAGRTDAVDGTNAPAGSMQALANLVPDPAMAGCYVPRAAASLNTFWPGFVSGLCVVGDIAFGMFASRTFPGSDEPFAYNIRTGIPLPLDGVIADNVPLAAPVTGPWEPPILAKVGPRIIVTHPGFDNGADKFGWFDVSGFNQTVTANVINTTSFVSGNPDVLGVEPGFTISGPNLQADTRVKGTTLYVNKCIGDITAGSVTILNVSVTSGLAIGQVIEGAGIQTGSIIDNFAGTTVTMNNVATVTQARSAITFSGATILIDKAAVGATNNALLTIKGGTLTLPQWGAGDADRNHLASRPVGVAQFNGRAYFALSPDPLTGAALGMQFSDSGLPCRISNTLAVQALTPGNGLPVTAVAPLMLSSPLLTGGAVAALLGFQGATAIQQITGDPETQDLRMNSIPVQTGTLAPLSLATCEIGTAFVSPDGLRVVKFDGTVTPPIGEAGTGVCLPFINTAEPSRIVAACNRGVVRITNADATFPGNALAEHWYDTKRKTWTGPHSFPASLIQPWRNTFILSIYDAQNGAALYQSDPVPGPNSLYVENGAVLSWLYQPTPLPDSGGVNMNALVDMTIALQLPLGLTITVNAADIDGFGLGQAVIPAPAQGDVWGGFKWGVGHWGGGQTSYKQYGCDFDKPLEFKQLVVTARGQSAHDTRVGNLYMKYQTLGYKLEAA